jgi:hypothetical protein
MYMILEQPIDMEFLWIGRTEVVFCRESHSNQQEATSLTAHQSTCQTHTMDDSYSQPEQATDSLHFTSRVTSLVQRQHVFFPPSPSNALSIAMRNLRSAPVWDITQVTVVVPYGRFGTTYTYRLQGSRQFVLDIPGQRRWIVGLCVCSKLHCL